MLGHYIDDDELDALNVKNLVKTENNLAITCSNSLSDIDEWIQPGEVDFILLDINRPDAKSIEDDLIEIRKFSKAPVLFLTGGNAEDYRLRATKAGAEAVIDKNSLSLELLQQLLLNIVAKSVVQLPATNQPERIEPLALAHEKTNSNESKMTLALSYLDTSITNIQEAQYDEKQLQRSLLFLSDVVRSLKIHTVAANEIDEPSASATTIPKMLRELQVTALSKAADKNVKIIFQLSKSGFMKLGQPETAMRGIKHLLNGAIQASRVGGTLSFTGVATPNGLKITISSGTKLVPSTDYIFTKRSPVYLKSYEAMFSMNLAALLLNLEPDDIQILSHGSVHRIEFDIVTKGQMLIAK